MSLISRCLSRLTQPGRSEVSSLARRHAAAARLARLTRPEPGGAALPCASVDPGSAMAEPAADGEPSMSCGWYESSLALRQGLAVTEWVDTEQAEGLQSWHAAFRTGALPARVAATQPCC